MKSQTLPAERSANREAHPGLLQHSPKLSTNKWRNEEYFSLIDVNLKQLARGTKMPAQYMRYTDTQMKQLTENPPTKPHRPPEEKKNDAQSNRNERTIQSACPISRIDRVLGYKFNDKENPQQESIQQRDPFMPKGYSLYERAVQTEANNSNHNPSSTRNAYIKIKTKGINSTVFSKKDNEAGPTVKKIREYKTHDIFGKAVVSNPVRIHYSSIKESGSAWLPTFISPTYYNHCTTEHNLINPAAKNTSLTKSQVKSTNKSFDPSHRQKGFCEYFDLTRVTAPNINKDYVKFANRPKSSFGKSKEICTNYYDSYNSYKDLCDKPFINKK